MENSFLSKMQPYKSTKSSKHVELALGPEDSPTGSLPEYESKEDAVLWRQFRQGDRDAFSHIYKQYIQALVAFGQQIVPDKELVKDCIHNLFIDLSKPGKKDQEVKSIKSYLFKSLYRLLVKSKKREGIFALIPDQAQFDGFQLAFSDEKTLGDEESIQLKKKKIESTVNSLPARQREAFIYFFYEGLTYEEIAYVMGMSRVHSARKLVYRVIAKIKEKNDTTITLLSSAIVLIAILFWLLYA